MRSVGKKVKVGKTKVKATCCAKKKRCSSCPIRLLADGKMPPEYTVFKRKLVKVKDVKKKHRRSLPKAA